MSIAALEINDAGIAAVRGGELLAATPGYAVLGREPIVVGELAQRVARVEPVAVNNRFWSELGQQPLPMRTAGGRSNADLAYLHLMHIKEILGPDVDTLVCAVPASMRAPQLALLLGIARECGLPLVGFIDAAVAAWAACPDCGRLIHLDIQLHKAVVTAVQTEENSSISVLNGEGASPQSSGQEVRLERCESVLQAGLLALHEVWMQSIAQRFVTSTRFDPLHNAASEQALSDALPAWLEQLTSRKTIEIEMTFGGERHAVTLTREELRIAADAIYDRIVARLRRLRRAGQLTTIGLSSRAAALPGLADRLAELRDSRLVILPPGCSALVAAAHASLFKATDESAELLNSAPRLAGEIAAHFAPRELPLQGPKAGTPPTHVLYRGQAHALGPQPLVVSLGDVEAANDNRTLHTLQIIGTTAGISPRHCSLLRTPQGAMVVDHSRYGTWLNDEIVIERAPLRAGDRLRVGRPGATLELIAID